MNRDDFQNRLVGVILAVIVLWIAAIAGTKFWDAFAKANDSGPMHSPSEWRR